MKVNINIPTSLAFLEFEAGVSTGTDKDTLPGVAFQLERYPGLRDMLDRFLQSNPPVQS